MVAKLDRFGGPKVNPVLGWHQAIHRLGILRAEIPHEPVKRFFRLSHGLRHSGLMEARLGLALNGLAR